MKDKQENLNKGIPPNPHRRGEEHPHKEFNESEKHEWVNPYPWFPALGEGKPGCVHISSVIVYYSLN